VDYGLGDPPKKLAHHCCLKILWDAVKCLLDDMATECIHAQCNSVTSDGVGNSLDLFRGAVLKASLDEKVSKSVNHKLISLSNDSIHDGMLLIGCTDLKLLLQKNGCLLIVIANNLIDDILPVAVHTSFK
jgi:hypothetical protein